MLKLDANVAVQTLTADVAHPSLVAALAWLFGVAVLPAREVIVLAALPAGFFGILFGLHFGVSPGMPGTTLVASTVLSAGTLSVAICSVSGMGQP